MLRHGGYTPGMTLPPQYKAKIPRPPGDGATAKSADQDIPEGDTTNSETKPRQNRSGVQNHPDSSTQHSGHALVWSSGCPAATYLNNHRTAWPPDRRRRGRSPDQSELGRPELGYSRQPHCETERRRVIQRVGRGHHLLRLFHSPRYDVPMHRHGQQLRGKQP